MQLIYPVLLLSCLLSTTFGMQLLGANRCTWGPGWWCVNETTANDCGATQHCVEHVWKSSTVKHKQNDAMETILRNPIGLLPVGIQPQTQPSESVTDDSCDTCIDRVLEIKILIKDNSTSAGFEQLLTKECIKWYSNADYCNEIVSQSSDAIFSLVRRSSPEQVCDYLLQCGDVCSQCKTDAVVAEKALSQNLTEQEIVDLSLDFCARLGPYSGACKSAITSRADIVVEDLVSFLQNDPCVSLGACESSLKQVTSDNECKACEFLWELVVHEISENSTETEIKASLDKLCTIFEKFANICTHLVDANLDNLLELFLKEESPHKFCSQVKLCNYSSTFALSLPTQSGAALLCSALASIFQSMVSTDLIVRAIVQVFYLTCNILPDDTAVENCQSFVMLYVAGILQILNAALPISYLCVAFLGDKGSNVNALSNFYEEQMELSPAVRTALECSVCEVVIDIVRMSVDTNKSIEDIEEDINIACHVFEEGSLRKVCESATELVPIILDLLQHNMDPEVICTVVGVCQESSGLQDTSVVPHSTEVEFDPTCFACKTGVTVTFAILSSNQTLQEVVYMLNGLCLILNPDSGCEAYLEQLLPSVLLYLKEEFSPETVCIAVGWCQNDEVGAYTTDENAPVEQTEDLGCLMCSALATLLDDYSETYTESDIVAKVDELCSQLGGFSEACRSVVEQQLPAVIEKLRAGESPRQICADLKCCQAVTARVSAFLLGGLSAGADDCDTCVEAVESIQSMLASKGEDYTEEYLMKQCIAAYSETVCSQAISHLIKVIESGDDPADICHELHLCSTSKLDLQAAMDCATCVKYGSEIEERINENMTSSEFKQVLLDLCDENSEIQSCKVFVYYYYRQMYNIVIKQGKSFEYICKEKGICSTPVATEVSSNTKYCTQCKFILSLTKQAFSKFSEDEIKQKVGSLCALVAEDQYEKCTELFDSFLSYLYNILSGDMSVSELCEEINACSSQVTLQRTYLQLWEQLQQSPSTDCVLCTWVSQAIHPQLIDLYPHNSLKSKLSSKCSNLPTHNQDSCEKLIENDYFISNLKSSSESPVCQTINICEGRNRPSGFSLFI